MKNEMIIKDYTQNKNFDYDFLIYQEPHLLWNNLVGHEGVLFLHIKNNPIKCHFSNSIYGSEYGKLIDKVLHD